MMRASSAWILVFFIIVALMLLISILYGFYTGFPQSYSGVVVDWYVKDRCLFGRYLWPPWLDQYGCATISPSVMQGVTCELHTFINGTATVYLDASTCTTLATVPIFFTTFMAPLILAVGAVLAVLSLVRAVSMYQEENGPPPPLPPSGTEADWQAPPPPDSPPSYHAPSPPPSYVV